MYPSMEHDLPLPSGEDPAKEPLSENKPLKPPCDRKAASPLTSPENEVDELREQLAFLRAQLAESEKMATIGQMTASIGHEIKNLISFVAASIGPLRLDFDDLNQILQTLQSMKNSSTPQADLERVLQLSESLETPLLISEIGTLLDGLDEGTRRAQDIVSGLKHFSRTDEPDFVLADIHQGIDATLLLLKHKMRGSIQVQKAYTPLPEVECIPGKLSQVFMNILSNAIQAIEQKETEDGVLSLRTALIGTDLVRIWIEDNGIGMRPEVLTHIFDPFYSTKSRQEGNGLGLSICNTIIQLHKGSIQVNSVPGEGAEFVISLPVRQ